MTRSWRSLASCTTAELFPAVTHRGAGFALVLTFCWWYDAVNCKQFLLQQSSTAIWKTLKWHTPILWLVNGRQMSFWICDVSFFMRQISLSFGHKLNVSCRSVSSWNTPPICIGQVFLGEECCRAWIMQCCLLTLSQVLSLQKQNACHVPLFVHIQCSPKVTDRRLPKSGPHWINVDADVSYIFGADTQDNSNASCCKQQWGKWIFTSAPVAISNNTSQEQRFCGVFLLSLSMHLDFISKMPQPQCFRLFCSSCTHHVFAQLRKGIVWTSLKLLCSIWRGLGGRRKKDKELH